MPARRRPAPRRRNAAAAGAGRGRRARRANPGRAAARELREVLRAQVKSGHELRSTRVPIATEPAFAFKP